MKNLEDDLVEKEWTLSENATHATFLSDIEADHLFIEITGTEAIPEFPVNLMIIAAIGLTAVVVAVRLRSRLSLR